MPAGAPMQMPGASPGGPPPPAAPQDIQFIRGPDGRMAGVQFAGVTLTFQRGPDGRITGMQPSQGGPPPGVEMPPDFITQGPQPNGPIPLPPPMR